MAKKLSESGGAKSANVARDPSAARKPSKKDQAMQAKARQAAEAEAEDDEDEEDFDDEPTMLQEWIKQSPSMIVSMVVHLVLFLIILIWPISQALQDNSDEVVSFPVEEMVISEEIVEDPPPPEEQVVAEVANEILEPVPETSEAVETDANDPEAAAPVFDVVETSEFASPVKPGKSKLAAGSGLTGLGSRTGAKRGRGLRRGGGTPGSENAVGAGLTWLANHQNSNGSWSFNHTPGDKCSGFPNPGNKTSKMGATGLALLAFLGAGHTHQATGKFKGVVTKGVAYLMKNMDPRSGRLYEANGENHTHMYCHGIAACAMAEAYGMTRDKKLRAPAQLALNYIVNAQAADGGWRYAPKDPGDTSAVGWQIMAFKSGKMSYLTVPEHVYPNAMQFLDSVQHADGAQYRYMPKGGHESEATTAIGLLCRNYMGWEKDHPGLKGGVSFLGGRGPDSDNMYYNYYATMVMFQNDGPRGAAWKGWNDVMREQLIRTQERKGGIHRVGSWFFSGDNGHGEGEAGGRLYHTALATMTLQVYYRYDQVYKK
ncbi:MAG: hypothetical protein DWQ42_13730 [Planctomycetota bacterium]|nr:MAG: hypothetical protein DWQ42_13730 [Planctomycetota bacterium]REK39343.1 MAG: hypothetical protein DWQ46_18885 [Planctomycetota bacterium]